MSAALVFAVTCLTLVGLGGCLFSDQTGKPFDNSVGFAAGDKLGDITFHFRSTMNYVVLALRLVLFGGLVWLTRAAFKAEHRQHVVVLIGLVAVCVAAFWFAGTGLLRVSSYRIAVTDTKLSIAIPFDTHVDLKWTEIAGVRAKGQRVFIQRKFSRAEPMYNKWKTLEIRTRSGKTHQVDLEALTVVQRSNLVEAIADRSGMHRRDVSPPP